MYIGDIINFKGLTTAEINAISSPQLGDLVNNITLNKYQRWNGTAWTDLVLFTQQQSDWNATSGVTAILNKPTLFSGNYNDLSNLPNLSNLNYWKTIGNAGTNPTSNFIGTTDAQDLAFRTNNIERVRILSGGNISVINKLTTSTLQITTGSSVNSVLVSDALGNGSWSSLNTLAWGLNGNSGTNTANDFIGTTDNQDLIFKTNSVERLRFRGGDGKVTFNSASIFEINGANTLKLYTFGSFEALGTSLVIKPGTGGWLRLNTNGTERVSITSAGNLLVGTTTDSGYKLSVNGNIRIENTSSDSSLTIKSPSGLYYPKIRFEQDGGSMYSEIVGNSNQITYYGEYHSFYNKLGNTMFMSVRQTGNVLIGTSTDSGYKLDVNGTGSFRTTGSTVNDIAFRVRDNTNAFNILEVTGNNKVTVRNTLELNVSSGSAVFYIRSGSDTAAYSFQGNQLNTESPTRHVVTTSNVERFRVETLYSAFSNPLKIGSALSPLNSAVLDIESTTKGFLPPRMTSAQRTAIASPAVGLIVYQTDATEGLYVNSSTGWIML